MRYEFETMTIGDCCDIIKKSIYPEKRQVYTCFSLPAFDNSNTPEILNGEDIKSSKFVLDENTILFNKLNPKFRRVWNIHSLEKYENTICSTEFLPLKAKANIEQDYLYYYISSPYFTRLMDGIRTGTSNSQQRIDWKQFLREQINVPSLPIQRKVVSLLRNIDKKIELNNAINNNLLEQVLTLYRNKFVDTANNERAICRADEYFDISIGKTPPRKEPQWFSTNPQDVTWVSISDMGTCGLYISSSSEQLTKQAVERHNVKVVPDNTVLLSFKLTVGRIAITNGEMTTNEAIAHFKTDKKEINEYLYCYLKCFNYQTMGSTSSIATAVNSKIIKGMPFVVPTNDELEEFHGFAAPMFAKIKANQIETDNLTALRDTLLPKLMSGELDVSDIDL